MEQAVSKIQPWNKTRDIDWEERWRQWYTALLATPSVPSGVCWGRNHQTDSSSRSWWHSTLLSKKTCERKLNLEYYHEIYSFLISHSGISNDINHITETVSFTAVSLWKLIFIFSQSLLVGWTIIGQSLSLHCRIVTTLFKERGVIHFVQKTESDYYSVFHGLICRLSISDCEVKYFASQWVTKRHTTEVRYWTKPYKY